MDRLLWYVFAGSRGGATRTRIMRVLLVQPMNTNQIAQELEMDYKTIEYNLRVLDKHAFAVRRTEGYGQPWEASRNLLAARQEFEEIARRLPGTRDLAASGRASKGSGDPESGKQPNTVEEE